MISQSDFDYISEGIIEMYSELGYEMMYVPLDRTTSKPDVYGDIVPQFNEYRTFKVYGIFSFDTKKDKELDRKDPQATNRIDAVIKLVVNQIKEAGLTIQKGDAIDVTDENGETTRYIIMGHDKKVEMPYILSRLLVTSKDSLVGI